MGVQLHNNIPVFRSWLMPFQWASSSTTTTGTAGRVYAASFDVPISLSLDGVMIYNYATVAGNIRVGIYKSSTKDVIDGADLIMDSADTALAGTNQKQFIPFSSSIKLSPGQYWIAFELSDVTHTFGQSTINITTNEENLRQYDRGGGYGALTNPCPVTSKGGRIFNCALRVESS